MPRILLATILISISYIVPAMADCTGPAGAESATRYDFTAHKLYYCNGTNWVEIGGAGGGITAVTDMSCSKSGLNSSCTATCPASYFRTACNTAYTVAASTSTSCTFSSNGVVSGQVFCAK